MPVTLQSADKSMRHLKRIFKEVLRQIDNFYFHIDFIVIGIAYVTNPHLQISIILGQPFLALANILIGEKEW